MTHKTRLKRALALMAESQWWYWTLLSISADVAPEARDIARALASANAKASAL